MGGSGVPQGGPGVSARSAGKFLGNALKRPYFWVPEGSRAGLGGWVGTPSPGAKKNPDGALLGSGCPRVLAGGLIGSGTTAGTAAEVLPDPEPGPLGVAPQPATHACCRKRRIDGIRNANDGGWCVFGK